MSAQLTFVTSPLGFEPRTDFELIPVDGADALYRLAGGSVRLFVIGAAVHLPTYRPQLERHLHEVGALSIDDVDVLVVVNPGEVETTVNLVAPIIVNKATGASVQLILEDQNWPLREKLL